MAYLPSLAILHGEANSQAYSINKQRQVVGLSTTKPTGGCNHAFLWDNGTMYLLSTLGGPGGTAFAIDNSAQVVGQSRISWSTSEVHAFVWEDGQMFDLNLLIPPGSGILLQGGYYINNRGHVSGIGRVLATNAAVGFLLTPEP